jgi:branched-chain amino acid transport system substrate-binding protein
MTMFGKQAITKTLAALIVALIVIAAISGVFVYQYMQPTVLEKKTVSIGFISTLTGFVSSTGTRHLRGAELAVQDINNKGGVLGMNMSLIIEDEGAGSAATVSATSRLVAAQPFAIVGYYFSGDLLAAEPTLVNNKMLTIATEPTALTILDPIQKDYETYKYIFQMHTRIGQGTPIVGFVSDVVKAKTYVSVSENYAWANLQNEWIEQQLTDRGIQKLAADYLPGDTNDYSTEIAKIASLHPDVVYVCMSGTNEALFQKQYVQNPNTAAIPIMHVPTGGVEIPSVVKDLVASQPGSVDYMAQGTYGLPYIVKTDKTLAYYAEYQNAYGEAATLFADGMVYDDVMLLAQAINTAGKLDREAVIKVLETQSYTGVVGTWKFGQDHRAIWEVPELTGAIIQYVPNDSAIVTNIIWPSSIANATYVKPP